MIKIPPPPLHDFAKNHFVIFFIALLSISIISCSSEPLLESTSSDSLGEVEEPKLAKETYFHRKDVKVENGILRFESKKKFHEFSDGTANLSDSIYLAWANTLGFSSLRLSYIKANQSFDFETGQCGSCLDGISELVTLYSDGEPILLNHSVPLGGLLSEEGFVQIEDRIYYLELRLNVSVHQDDLTILRDAVRTSDYSNGKIDVLMDVRSDDNRLSSRYEDKSVPCEDSEVTFYEIPRFKHGNGETTKRKKRWQRVHWRFSNIVIGGYDARDVSTQWWTESRSYKRTSTNVYSTNHYFAAEINTRRVDGSNYLNTFYPWIQYQGHKTKDVTVLIQRTTGLNENIRDNYFRYIEYMYPYTRTSHQGMGTTNYARVFCE